MQVTQYWRNVLKCLSLHSNSKSGIYNTLQERSQIFDVVGQFPNGSVYRDPN